MIALQFIRGDDLGGKLIQWFGGGPKYSHVDSILPGGKLLGARHDETGGAPAGVQIRDSDYIGDHSTLRIYLPCSTDVTEAYYGFLMTQIGKPYDDEGILAFVAGRDWQDPCAWFCSELVASGLQKCGFLQYPLASPSNKITPPDLVLILSALVPITL